MSNNKRTMSNKRTLDEEYYLSLLRTFPAISLSFLPYYKKYGGKIISTRFGKSLSVIFKTTSTNSDNTYHYVELDCINDSVKSILYISYLLHDMQQYIVSTYSYMHGDDINNYIFHSSNGERLVSKRIIKDQFYRAFSTPKKDLTISSPLFDQIKSSIFREILNNELLLNAE